MIFLLLACLTVVVFLLPYGLISANPFPRPSGQWPVGSSDFIWNLPTHSGIIAKIWYPSNAKNHSSSPYIDHLGLTLSAITAGLGPLSRLIFNKFYLGRIQIPSEVDATLAERQGNFPIILFSPGFGGINFLNSFYALEFASHGFIVISINHPQWSSGTILVDGSHVPFNGIDFNKVDIDRAEKLLATTISQKANNLSAVLDELLDLNKSADSWLYQKIDPSKVFAVGHSSGGSASFLACERDSRITKSVNLDGFLYQDRIDVFVMEKEFLLILSNRDKYAPQGNKTPNIFDLLMAKDQTRVAQFSDQKNVHKYLLNSANHWSFMDLSLIITPLLSERLGWFGEIKGLDLMSETSETIIDFFNEAD